MLNNNFKCSHSYFIFKAISKQTLSFVTFNVSNVSKTLYF
nr:MAG TPA: hypothetical protein [Caudoviricetes sp.]